MRKFCTVAFLLATAYTAAAQQGIGVFDAATNVGNPAIQGKVQYNDQTQEYTMQGAGSNMWFNNDQFQFLYKKIKGDFIISATVRFLGEGVNPHRKIGIIARDQLTANSRYADACVHGDDLTSLQYRPTDDANTEQVTLSVFHPNHIELERRGDTFYFSAAVHGAHYKTVSKVLPLNEEVYAGLFICSHEEKVVEKAVFSNVRVIIPAPRNFTPYREYIGSHIEVMDVQTGLRTIVYSAANSLQAPNWTKDNQLLYNSEGLLYKFNLANGAIQKVNTGFANQNNNDHVLSFDGKQIGISHHTGEKRTSTLYTLPIAGSDQPKQVTRDTGHSWLHGFSPDGKKLVFTGWRKNQYDIWTIDIATGKETQLTNTPTLDDSPEYSPDGKWIYFNSVRTGTMKLWRMRADGSNEEQVTFDEYNDWFPHFSPDGKWIVYLSYPKDIDPTDHPWYKKVYIRLMPAAGGVPKTIAYVYGGQGTINVPSWSPDSKRIAFVSNSKL